MFIEQENFGLNAVTIGAALMLTFTIAGTYVLWEQIKKIWRHKSGVSLSITWSVTLFFMFVILIEYGLNEWSLAYLIQGIFRTGCYIIILYGLFKFKEWAPHDYLIFAIGSFLCIAAAIHKPYLETVFIGISIAGIIGVIHQACVLWQARIRGIVHMPVVFVYGANAATWIFYSAIIGKWWIATLNGAFVGLYILITLTYYFRCSPETELHNKSPA
ncbi:hypothetical protein L0Y49_00115 [bacterium]|nr:hypothetical protein [bacterium]